MYICCVLLNNPTECYLVAKLYQHLEVIRPYFCNLLPVTSIPGLSCVNAFSHIEGEKR